MNTFLKTISVVKFKETKQPVVGFSESTTIFGNQIHLGRGLGRLGSNGTEHLVLIMFQILVE